jgi:hypothetical protein
VSSATIVAAPARSELSTQRRVWETMEQFDAFAQQSIGPNTQKAGFAGPPERTVYEVHNHLGH